METPSIKITKKEALNIGSVMPSIGFRYYIIENDKRIYGEVESHQGDTGKFWVKWDDGEITLESKCDTYVDYSA